MPNQHRRPTHPKQPNGQRKPTPIRRHGVKRGLLAPAAGLRYEEVDEVLDELDELLGPAFGVPAINYPRRRS
jgi:hypothetical protein